MGAPSDRTLCTYCLVLTRKQDCVGRLRATLVSTAAWLGLAGHRGSLHCGLVRAGWTQRQEIHTTTVGHPLTMVTGTLGQSAVEHTWRKEERS